MLKPIGIEVSYEDYRRRFIGVSNREMIRQLCADAGVAFDPQCFDAWYAQKRNLYQSKDLKIPDPVARYLAEGLTGYRLAVVSSSRRCEVEPYLVRSGVRDRLTAVVCAEDVSELKPAPEAYRLAAELLGVTPARCLAVEDSDAGAESARRAGMLVARVAGPHEVVERVTSALSVR